jgi:hypothetical protein
MKTKIYLILLGFFALTVSLNACTSQDKKSKSTEQVSAQKTYQCPMKCEGDKTYNEPGKCPKCGMDLTEKI